MKKFEEAKIEVVRLREIATGPRPYIDPIEGPGSEVIEYPGDVTASSPN